MLDQLPFARIVVCDTEFQTRPGDLVLPVCLVAKELRSGQTWRLWMGEFGSSPPYPIDKEHPLRRVLRAGRAVGQPGERLARPARVLDLFAERRLAVNGLPWREGAWSLLGAMVDHGLDPGPSAIKDAMRDRIIAGPPFSHNERAEILAYCERDVDGTAQLLERMLPGILARPHGLVHALNRGSYGIAVAAMEATGIPIDTATLGRLQTPLGRDQRPAGRRWRPRIRRFRRPRDRPEAVRRVHRPAPDRLAAHREDRRAEPRQGHLQGHGAGQAPPAAQPAQGAAGHPGAAAPERPPGRPGRAQPMLAEAVLVEDRAQPAVKLSQYVFGNATWYRGLIKPGPGRAILYADWRCQEIGIEAAASQDPAMLEALATDDFYIAFGKKARALPDHATRETHGIERDGLKTVALGVGYGMQEQSLAVRLAKTCPEARELLRLHRRTFPRFWAWNDDVVHYAKLNGKLWTTYGWELAVTEPQYQADGRQIGGTKVRTLRNYLMQGNAAEMLRIACYRFVAKGGLDRGFLLCGPVHDALLVECAIEDMAEATQFTAERHAGGQPAPSWAASPSGSIRRCGATPTGSWTRSAVGRPGIGSWATWQG